MGLLLASMSSKYLMNSFFSLYLNTFLLRYYKNTTTTPPIMSNPDTWCIDTDLPGVKKLNDLEGHFPENNKSF